MKRYQLFFALVSVLAEFSIVFGCFFLARAIRAVTDLIPRVQLPIQYISDKNLFGFALFGSILFVAVFALRQMYRVKGGKFLDGNIGSITSSAFSWFGYYIALVYLSAGFLYNQEIPRLIILFTFLLSIPSLWIFRSIFSFVQNFLLKKGILPARKILILSQEENEAIAEIKENLGYKICGIFNGNNVLDTEARILDMIRHQEIDEILSLDSSFSSESLERIFELARIYGIAYRYADSFLFSESFKTEIDFLSGVPIVEIVSIGLTPWGRILKRTFDIVVSLIALIVLFPFLVIVSLIVYFGDFHAPIYRSERIGKSGKPFFMYKFRSMRPDADVLKKELLAKNERVGPLFKIEKDPRITPIGRFIRRFDIDELPQLFNVLIGDMSLIGPRPHLPDEVSQYQEAQRRVLTLKPGITGMAQVNGRHKNSFEDEVRLDVFYIEKWDLFLDLKILIKTISVVFARGFR